MPQLRVGLIGLDTSHAPAFARLLNDKSQPHRVRGGRVVAAFTGGSDDFALSRDRVQTFAAQVQSEGVELLDSPAAVARACDALLLTSVDGRVHLDQFRAIAPFGKPVFVDKPFALSSESAREITELARQNGVPLMSCSSLRYAVPLVEALATAEQISGGDFCGPMNFEPTQPGFFWYGIHAIEMLYASFGAGCERVSVVSNADYDIISALWRDGRIATVRGNRVGNATFGALLHGPKTSRYVDAYAHPKPAYAALLEQIMAFFASGQAPIDPDETLEIVRFIEAANQSRHSAEAVTL